MAGALQIFGEALFKHQQKTDKDFRREII